MTVATVLMAQTSEFDRRFTQRSVLYHGGLSFGRSSSPTWTGVRCVQ